MPRNVVLTDSAIYNAGRDQYNHYSVNGGVHIHHHHYHNYYNRRYDDRREDMIVLWIALWIVVVFLFFLAL